MRKALLVLACAIAPLSADRLTPSPGFAAVTTSAASLSGEAERYVLPITPPLDQGDSDLCWVYATLSMLETNYMVRHPGSQIALSRGYLQAASIADRFARLVDSGQGELKDGGLAVEALALIRRDGLIARGDFPDVVDPAPVYASVKQELAAIPDRADKLELLSEALPGQLGSQPDVTHLDGRPLTPRQLAHAVLGAHAWIEYDRARGEDEGWGPSRDPDARPETRVMYVKIERMIELIHRSLAHGQAVVAGTDDHAFLIYGADYDQDGNPVSYMIKDSLAPLIRSASAEELHRTLNDVTVAF